MQAVAYRGRSVPESLESPWYQLDAADISGPVDRQIFGACLFVARNQKVRARKTMGRIDLPQYDMAAVFEAVVNAVAHRDWVRLFFVDAEQGPLGASAGFWERHSEEVSDPSKADGEEGC